MASIGTQPKGASVIKGILSLSLLGLFSKLVTFTLNNILLRYVAPETLGLVGVKLELVFAAIGFLGRETSRLVAYEGKTEERTKVNQRQESINVSYVSILLTGSLCILAYLYASWTPTESKVLLKGPLQLYLAATFFESLVEPVYVLQRNQMQFSQRSLIESTALFVKSAVTFGGIVGAKVEGQHSQLLVYGTSQLSYAMALLFGYVFSNGLYSWPLPHRCKNGEWMSSEKIQLFSSFGKQSLLKFLLTEGDKLLLSSFVSAGSSAMGVFAFVMNYGSLLARLLFQPVEETSRSLFASAKQTEDVVEHMEVVLRLYAVLSILVCSVGINFSSAFVYLVGGDKWLATDAPSCLQIFLLSLPILALNGMLEGYFQTTSNPKQLNSFTRYLLLAWVVFAAAGFVGISVWDLGSRAIIVANTLNAGMRLCYCWPSALKRLNRPRALYPSRIFSFPLPTIAVAAISFALTHMSNARFLKTRGRQTLAIHVAVGASCSLLQLLVMYRSGTFANIANRLRRKSKRS